MRLNQLTDQIKLENIAGDQINPATTENIAELQTLLTQIYNAVDGLELSVDNIDINTDELETKVQSVRDQLDVVLSTRFSEATGQSILQALGEISGTDIISELKNLVAKDFSTESTLIEVRDYLDTVETKLQTIINKDFATESTLSSVLSQLDISLSSLRDAIKGTNNKDLSTVEEDIEAILAKINVDLSTRASESSLQALLSATGEQSGTSVLNELQNILGQLDVALSTRATETTLIEVRDYLDTVESKLQTIINSLGESSGTNITNELEQLNNKSAEIRDTIGQESGSTVLSKLQNIWDKLKESFTDGLAKIKIWDGFNVTDVITQSGKPNRLAVEAYQADGTENFVIIKDGEGDGYLAKVDATGRLLVSTQTVNPPETTGVVETYYGNIAGTVDNFYTIPNGETLRLTRLTASAEVGTTAGTVIELYYAPNGDTTGLEILDALFSSGNSDQHDLSQEFVGDGTKAILLRRRRLSGGSKEVFARWEGYY